MEGRPEKKKIANRVMEKRGRAKESGETLIKKWEVYLKTKTMR